MTFLANQTFSWRYWSCTVTVIVRKIVQSTKSLITNWRTGKRHVGNTANTFLPSGTSCSGFNLASLRATTLKSAKALVYSVWLFSHYFTNPSYCPINQSEFCGRQRPQKWSNRGLHSRRSLPCSSPSPLLCFFSQNSLPHPTPYTLYACYTIYSKGELIFWREVREKS